MKVKTCKTVRLVSGVLLSAMTVIVGALFIWQVLYIYLSGTAEGYAIYANGRRFFTPSVLTEPKISQSYYYTHTDKKDSQPGQKRSKRAAHHAPVLPAGNFLLYLISAVVLFFLRRVVPFKPFDIHISKGRRGIQIVLFLILSGHFLSLF